ncbi:hypothetical protein FQA39_LY00165 [Lamprigera yunnana]|nr:hypothetical protein FQA39_LY00165 [Lamprigera yunnana]
MQNRNDREMGLYPARGKISNNNQLYYVNPHEDAFDTEPGPNTQHYRRMNGSPSNTNGIPELSNRYNRRSEKVIKRGLAAQGNQPLGLVYRKGKLLGILESYPALYELSPYSDDQGEVAEMQTMSSIQSIEDMKYPSHLASLSDEEYSEKDRRNLNEYVTYTDDKYPMILTDFKIDSKLDSLDSNKQEKMQLSDKQPKSTKVKHSVNDKDETVENLSDVISSDGTEMDDHSDQLHTFLLKDTDTVQEVENKLNGIFNNEGLLNSNNVGKNKRKIQMKRDVSIEKDQMGVETELKSTESSIVSEKGENKREIPTVEVRDYQTEGETYLRNKRNEISTENVDIMKGLEKSGDLTVSGNKSPLASSENESKITEKRKNADIKTGPSLAEVSADNEDYEKQLQKSIQQRIDAIREEVKREIASLQEKRKVELKERQKGNVLNTLIDSKVNNLNPETQPEGSSLSYIRTKRNLNNYSSDLPKSFQNLNILKNDDSIFNDDNTFEEGDNDIPSIHINTDVDDNAESKSVKRNDYTSEQPSLNEGTTSPFNDHDSILKTNAKRFSNAFMDYSNAVHNEPMRKLRESDLLKTLPNVASLRKKRAERLLVDGDTAYVPYTAEDEEVDKEKGEFDDDSFYAGNSELQKRDVYNANLDDQSSQLQNLVEYEIPNRPIIKRYVSNLNTDVYENLFPTFIENNDDPSPYMRKKRNNLDGLVTLHGGGPMVNHRSALREKNIRILGNADRKKRNFQKVTLKPRDNKNEQQSIADLSDTDIFGALPQNYKGELSRFKRVKKEASRTNNIMK